VGRTAVCSDFCSSCFPREHNAMAACGPAYPRVGGQFRVMPAWPRYSVSYLIETSAFPEGGVVGV